MGEKLSQATELCMKMNSLKADCVCAEEAARKGLDPRAVGLMFRGLASQIDVVWNMAVRIKEKE